MSSRKKPTVCSSFIAWALALLLLSGCAGKMPRTAPLEADAALEARLRFEALLTTTCPASLDADLSLHWETLTGEVTIPSTLQLQAPDHLRYAMLDPLGRPIFLLSADSSGFIAADQRTSTGMTGTGQSELWRQYVPAGLTIRELLPLLQGQVPPVGIAHIDAEQDTGGKGVWFVVRYVSGLTAFVRLDVAGRHVQEIIYFDGEGTRLAALLYSGYPEGSGDSCALPGVIAVEGAALDGAVEIKYGLIASRSPLAETLFHLVIPDSYSVQELE